MEFPEDFNCFERPDSIKIAIFLAYLKKHGSRALSNAHILAYRRGPKGKTYNAFVLCAGNREESLQTVSIWEEDNCWVGEYRFMMEGKTWIVEVVYWCPKGHIIYQAKGKKDIHLEGSLGKDSRLSIRRTCMKCCRT